jgi:hypothetical protein
MAIYKITAQAQKLSDIPWGSIVPGDTIELYGTFYDRLNVQKSGTNSNPIIIRGVDCTITPRYYINGTQSLDSNGLSSTQSWVNVSGDIWKKTIGIAPRYVFIDGIKRDPIKQLNPYSQTESWIIANLQPNEWMNKSGYTLYINLGPGKTPSNTDIAINAANQIIPGAIYIDSVSNIIFENFSVYGFLPGTQSGTIEAVYKYSSVYIKQSNYISFKNIQITNNLIGMYISGGTNISIDTKTKFYLNEGFGLGIDGYYSDLSNVYVGATFELNGAYPIFDGTVWNVSYDCDGFGIGQLGGNMSNINVLGAKFIQNGPLNGIPSYSGGTLNRGSGIFLGTGYTAAVTLNIIGCLFDDNYRYAVNINGNASKMFKGGVFYGNIIKNTRYDTGASGVGAVTFINMPTQFSIPTYISNNIFTENKTHRALFVDFGTTASGIIANNIFNNGVSSASVVNQADLAIDRAKDNINLLEINNIFYRTDSEYIARYWSQNISETRQIRYSDDTSSYINSFIAANKMKNWIKSNPILDSNYIPATNSPAIGTGYKFWGENARPTSYNQEPLPDIGIDIGAIQTYNNTFHPKNIK